MRSLRISDARALGEILGAKGVVVIALEPHSNPGQVATASWGRDRAKCQALAEFLDGPLADLLKFEPPEL